MARHHDDAGQLAEPVFHEGGRFVVEVVGRLVQEEGRGAAYEKRGQGEAAALPAGQGAERPVVRDAAEAEPVEDDRGPAVGVPGFAFLGLFEPLPIRLQQFGVGGAVLGGVGEQSAEPVEFGQVGAGFPEGVVQDPGDRRVSGERHLLVQEAQVVRAGDLAGVGFVDAREQAQQCRFADTVLADQPDAVAGCGGEGHAVQDPSGPQCADEVVGEQSWSGHGGPPGVREVRGPPGEAPRTRARPWPAPHTSGAAVSRSSPSASRSHRSMPMRPRKRSSWLTTTNAPW